MDGVFERQEIYEYSLNRFGDDELLKSAILYRDRKITVGAAAKDNPRFTPKIIFRPQKFIWEVRTRGISKGENFRQQMQPPKF